MPVSHHRLLGRPESTNNRSLARLRLPSSLSGVGFKPLFAAMPDGLGHRTHTLSRAVSNDPVFTTHITARYYRRGSADQLQTLRGHHLRSAAPHETVEMRRGALLLSALPDLLTSHEPTLFSSALGWVRLTLFSLGHLSTGFPRLCRRSGFHPTDLRTRTRLAFPRTRTLLFALMLLGRCV